MHVCMYACMHVRMYACMYVCMYVCMHVSMCLCVYLSIYLSIYPSINLSICVFMKVSSSEGIRTLCTYVNINTHTHACLDTCILQSENVCVHIDLCTLNPKPPTLNPNP